MSNNDDHQLLSREAAICLAEQRAYSRGYAAGRKRKARERLADRVRAANQAFIDRAFIALLPTAMESTGWKIDGKLVTTSEEKMSLARIWAANAFKYRPLV